LGLEGAVVQTFQELPTQLLTPLSAHTTPVFARDLSPFSSKCRTASTTPPHIRKKQGRGRRKREREKLSAVMHLPALPSLPLTSKLLTHPVRTSSAVSRSISRRLTLQSPLRLFNSPPAESCSRVPVHRRRFFIGAAPCAGSLLPTKAAAAGWRP
jgi:hypothetical protein